MVIRTKDGGEELMARLSQWICRGVDTSYLDRYRYLVGCYR